MPDARAIARDLAASLSAPKEAAEAELIALGKYSDEQWQNISVHLPSLESDDITRLSARVRELSSSSRNDAVALARLATRLAASVNSAPARLLGQTYADLGEALFDMAEYAAARDAVLRARRKYDEGGDVRFEHANLDLLEAKTLFELGDGEAALRVAERGMVEMKEVDPDGRHYPRARILYAGVLLGLDKLDEALAILTAVAGDAEAAGDRKMSLYATWNIGMCIARLGEPARGRRFLRRAMRQFEEMGNVAEIPYLHAAIAMTLRDEHRYDDAVSEYYKARARYLEVKQPVAAAIAQLRIVQCLMLAGKVASVPSRCEDMINVFVAARLQRNLRFALAYLRDAWERGRFDMADVDAVLQFFDTAKDQPDREFTAPS